MTRRRPPNAPAALGRRPYAIRLSSGESTELEAAALLAPRVRDARANHPRPQSAGGLIRSAALLVARRLNGGGRDSAQCTDEDRELFAAIYRGAELASPPSSSSPPASTRSRSSSSSTPTATVSALFGTVTCPTCLAAPGHGCRDTISHAPRPPGVFHTTRAALWHKGASAPGTKKAAPRRPRGAK